MEITTDVIVIGGGHAGCEAALAASRMGLDTVMFAISLDSIAMMPCNPNIGGTSKGHLVREIDALGGEMGRNIDKTYIQSRMLNTSKGPAVYSLRAQADKLRYSRSMRRALEAAARLSLVQSEITGLITEGGAFAGAVSENGITYRAKAAVLCAGTYMRARCLCGEAIAQCGPGGMRNAGRLSAALEEGLGLRLMRFKTGTPARIDRKSIDFSRMDIQLGDEPPTPFSFENSPADIARAQVPCYLTYTNAKTHDVIRASLHRSPLYAGVIEGTGTRYCPSIEDKIVRFADKERHQVFVEPEGEDTGEMYIAGMSTSLPADVQIRMYRTVSGLENAVITRYGYAIEYDCVDATQLKLNLEFKDIPGLFCAGQLNGSSGYEEAAAQGLVAGINAALRAKGGRPFTIDRSEGYIGVLIDDLVTKGSREPYRMMTSRAEYRLTLRQDNADLRLTDKGRALGLIGDGRYARFCEKREMIARETARAERLVIAPGPDTLALLEGFGSSPVVSGIGLAELIRRPELDYFKLAPLDPARPELPADAAEQVNIQLKYDGYIRRQAAQIEQFRKLEHRALPEGLRYEELKGLRLEARQKLAAVRPQNIGQASRITGVSPADISVLLVYLEQIRRRA